MLILNMGIPRSGTTWAFNVFRHILKSRGVAFRTVPANSRAEVDAALDGYTGDEVLIVHMHDVTDRLLEVARGSGVFPCFCYRDPRDVVVSQLHLHKTNFKTAIALTVSAYKSMERASRIAKVMFIPYPHIQRNSEALIFQMALRLGYLLDFDTLARIDEETSVRRHQEILSQPARSLENFLCDEHIQSGRNGRWKTELSTSRQERINKVFAHHIQFFRFDAVLDEQESGP